MKGDEREDEEQREREFFIDNLLVRKHFIIVMIRWTGLAYQDVEEADDDARDEGEDERHGEPGGVGVAGCRDPEHLLHQDQQRLRERTAKRNWV